MSITKQVHEQGYSIQVTLYIRSHVNLLSSVAFLFCLDLNDALWLASRALKLVAVMPTYVSEVSPEVTVLWYTMSSRRHSSFNRQVTFLGHP